MNNMLLKAPNVFVENGNCVEIDLLISLNKVSNLAPQTNQTFPTLTPLVGRSLHFGLCMFQQTNTKIVFHLSMTDGMKIVFVFIFNSHTM